MHFKEKMGPSVHQKNFFELKSQKMVTNIEQIGSKNMPKVHVPQAIRWYEKQVGIPTKARAGFFKLGLAQSREDPHGLTKCLGLLNIGPLEVLFKLFEFSRQKYFKI